MTNLLVVDDEPAVRALCSRVLTEAGYAVDLAQDGDDAVARVSAKRYDLVLSDLKMPGNVDGSELTKIIKQTSPGTNVVIMTGYPTAETAVDMLRQGAFDCLAKPFDITTMLHVISECLAAQIPR